MQITKTVRELSPAVDEIEYFLTKHHVTSGDKKCCRMLAEELFNAYREKQGCTRFSYTLSAQSGKAAVVFAFRCASWDITGDSSNPVILNVMKAASEQCTWEYKNGVNTVRCEFEAGRTLTQNLLYLAKFVKKEKMRIAMACTLQLIGMVLCVVIPVLSAHLIDNYAMNNISAVITTAFILLFVRIANDFVIYLANRLHNAAYNKIRYSIEMELANAIMKMQVNTIEEHGTGMIIQRMTGDTVALARGVETLVNRTFSFINYIGVLAAIFILCPGAFAVKFMSTVILIFIESCKSTSQVKNERAYLNQNDRFSDVVGEMVHGNRDIKLLNSEQSFVDELEGIIRETNRRHLYLWNTSQNYTVFSNEISNILEICFYLVVAFYLSTGHLQPTEAIVLFNYSLNLVGVSTFLGDFMNYAKSMGLSSERVYQLINKREFAKETFGTKHLDHITGDIEFRNVSFSYNTTDPSQEPVQVLNGLDIKINAGETVAFVGKSGCGKTTALNMITKLYTPSAGNVLLDGVDLCRLDKETIRGNIAVVSQNPYVFNMSIKENLRLIDPNLSEEKMVSVCKDACIHDEIMNLPNGYETVVGEGGVMLSGGQRQRLALARSMLKDHRIILLDEATSALDNLTQAHIQDTISRVKHSKTIVIVAHRLSTIKVCDRIFYFADGSVLAQGTHGQLMETCPEYRAQYMSE